jgi:hypothetical protein
MLSGTQGSLRNGKLQGAVVFSEDGAPVLTAAWPFRRMNSPPWSNPAERRAP